MIKQIAIIFGDNDFHSTFLNLLKTMIRVLEDHPNLEPDDVVRIIHEGIKFHYMAFQHPRHHDMKDQKDIDSTSEYLNQIRIIFNEDAINACCQEDHNAGAWYVDVVNKQLNSF